KVRTAGLDAMRRGREHLKNPTLVERARRLRALPLDPFSGQSIVDEHDFALDVRDASTLVIEVRDLRCLARELSRDSVPCPQQFGSRQAARNSWKCGFGCARSTSRTRASSRKYSSRFIRPRINWKRQKTRKVLSTSVSQ